MLPAEVRIALPDGIAQAVDASAVYPDDLDKVALAVELSRRNVAAQSGGPFGAAVFGPDHRLLAVGVNCVVPQHNSLAHAEIVALMLAQWAWRVPRLNTVARPITLASSSQPCCQCFGAMVWAGIDRLLIGARSDDVTALAGFDEGPLPPDWIGELHRRGIEVVRDLHRDTACAVLRAYRRDHGVSY